MDRLKNGNMQQHTCTYENKIFTVKIMLFMAIPRLYVNSRHITVCLFIFDTEMEVYNVVIASKRLTKTTKITSTSLKILDISFLLNNSTIFEVPGNNDLHNNGLMLNIFILICYLIKSLIKVLYVFEYVINLEEEINSLTIIFSKKLQCHGLRCSHYSTSQTCSHFGLL